MSRRSSAAPARQHVAAGELEVRGAARQELPAQRGVGGLRGGQRQARVDDLVRLGLEELPGAEALGEVLARGEELEQGLEELRAGHHAVLVHAHDHLLRDVRLAHADGGLHERGVEGLVVDLLVAAALHQVAVEAQGARELLVAEVHNHLRDLRRALGTLLVAVLSLHWVLLRRLLAHVAHHQPRCEEDHQSNELVHHGPEGHCHYPSERSRRGRVNVVSSQLRHRHRIKEAVETVVLTKHGNECAKSTTHEIWTLE